MSTVARHPSRAPAGTSTAVAPAPAGSPAPSTGSAPAAHAPAAAPVRPGSRWARWWVAALVGPAFLLAVATTTSLGSTGYSAISRGYPGGLTAVSSTVLRVVLDLASVTMAGALAHLTLLRARGGRDRLDISGAFELRVLRASSAVVVLAALLAVIVDAGDASGVSVLTALDPASFPVLLSGSSLPRAWLVVALCALVVHLLSYAARTFDQMLLPATLTAGVLLAPVVVTALLVGPWHDVGGDAGVITTLASAAAFGALAVAGLRAAVGRPLLPEALERTGTMAIIAGAVAMAYEVVVLAFFSGGALTALVGATGAWGVVRLLALAAAVVLGVSLRRDAAGPPGGAPRLLGLATLAAGVFVGAGVAMTRIPSPQYFVPTSIQQAFLGYDVPQDPTASVLLGDWRVNLLFATISAVAVGAYLVGYVRLRRRGDAWPAGRVVAWVAGWAVIVAVTSTGLGRYAAASFSLHMLVHMCLTMLGPLFMVLGGPMTLALRASRPAGADRPAGLHEWLVAVLRSRYLRVLSNPLLVFVVFVASYYLLYLTPLFDVAMRFHWSHQLMNLHFIASGYLYYGLVVGVDQPPRPLPHLGRLGFVLAAMPFHAFFAVAVMTSTSVIGRTYYEYLDRGWDADLLADQYVGGGIAWAAGEVPLLLVVLALAIQWARQDAREAKRKDRRADRAQSARQAGAAGGEDEVEAYNQMLARLSQRDSRPGGPR